MQISSKMCRFLKNVQISRNVQIWKNPKIAGPVVSSRTTYKKIVKRSALRPKENFKMMPTRHSDVSWRKCFACSENHQNVQKNVQILEKCADFHKMCRFEKCADSKKQLIFSRRKFSRPNFLFQTLHSIQANSSLQN